MYCTDICHLLLFNSDLETNAGEELSILGPQDDDIPECTSPNENVKEIFENLKQVFPGRDPEELTTAAQRSDNIHNAINEVLDSVLDENPSSGR